MDPGGGQNYLRGQAPMTPPLALDRWHCELHLLTWRRKFGSRRHTDGTWARAEQRFGQFLQDRVWDQGQIPVGPHTGHAKQLKGSPCIALTEFCRWQTSHDVVQACKHCLSKSKVSTKSLQQKLVMDAVERCWQIQKTKQRDLLSISSRQNISRTSFYF